jgi:hypothetical protein
MVQTITPVVHGGRARWLVAVGVHALGATAAAAAFGAVLGWTGARLGAPFGQAGSLVLAAVALAYAVGAAGFVRIPVPALRRQVPDWWRTFFTPMVTATLYGAGLGIGFLTFLGTGALVAVSVGAFAAGSVVGGAVLVGVFGAARGLSALRAWRVTDPDRGLAVVDHLASRSDRVRRLVAAAALGGVTLTAAVHAADAAGGGWPEVAAAGLAVTFAWAAFAKVAAPARWRRALLAHELPGPVQRVATWAVPAAEATVPALALLGYRRGAAMLSGLLLVVFAGAVLRRRLGGARAVACGCFGGHRERPVWLLSARLGGLALLASLAWRGAEPGPGLPPPPAGAEWVPAAMASLSILLAGILLQQRSRWLRSRA